MLGQFGAGQRPSDAIVADVGDLFQTIEQTERLKNAGIDANADVGVAGLYSLQGRAGRKGALGHDGHRQPPTPTGVVDVGAELAQGPPNGGGGIVWGRYMPPSRYRLSNYVARSLHISFPEAREVNEILILAHPAPGPRPAALRASVAVAS
jgi:hypothetical protein